MLATISALGLGLAACGGGSSSKQAAKPATGSSVPNVTPVTQIISDTVPAGAARIHLEAGPLPITPGQNNIQFTRTIPQPKRDGGIVGIKTNLRLAPIVPADYKIEPPETAVVSVDNHGSLELSLTLRRSSRPS